MCYISGKELQGKQLAVKHPFKQALTPGHLAGLKKDSLAHCSAQKPDKRAGALLGPPSPPLPCNLTVKCTRESSRQGASWG